MINLINKDLHTYYLTQHNLFNAVYEMILYLNTDINPGISGLSIDLNDFDPDNWVEFDDITDDNLIDWYCARKNITRQELETKLNTAYHTVEI